MELIQANAEKPFGQVVPSDLCYADLYSSDITLPTFGKLLNFSLASVKGVRIFLTSNDAFNLINQ